MAGFSDWKMSPAVSAGLEQLGWQAATPGVKEIVPAIARKGNVVAILPPSPSWATPALAALVGQTDGADGAILVLAPTALIGEFATTLGALLEATSLQVDVAREITDATRADVTGAAVVIASPETAFFRLTRSTLKPERFRAVVFAWPEQWHADDAVAGLLQDLPKESQRLVLTSNRDRLEGADGVVERYARKAIVVNGVTPDATTAGTHSLSLRAAPTSWSARAATVTNIVDAMPAGPLTIWTADARDHQQLRRVLGSLRPGLTIQAQGTPAAGGIVCYDVPSAAQLSHLSSIGDVVLMVAPGTEEYIARVAPSRRPMALSGSADVVMDRDARIRRSIADVVTSQDHSASLYALAPLFEEHDAQLVAAALFGLWQARQAPQAAPRVTTATIAPAASRGPIETPMTATGAVTKIWIGAGKKDDATVADFVAVLVREVGLDRSRIGRIELRDTFATVEVPPADAEAIVLRLSGITIRKRKLVARIDQAPGRSAGKPPANRRPR